MFKRRIPLTILQKLREFVYPRAGWGRALGYLGHRIRRLPDPPERVALGLACGVMSSFTPLFGFHFVIAATLAWMVRGNVLAALIGTLFGNPLTFPIIATVALWFGRTVLGLGHHTDTAGNFEVVAAAFAKAFLGFWQTMKSLVTPTPASFELLQEFFVDLFIPYLVGGIVPGLVAAVTTYFISAPLVAAYQKRRAEKRRKQLERKSKARRAARAALVAGDRKS